MTSQKIRQYFTLFPTLLWTFKLLMRAGDTSAWIRLSPVSIIYTVESVHMRFAIKHNCTQPCVRYTMGCPVLIR